MVGKRSAFQSKSGGHLVGIHSILAKFSFGNTGQGPPHPPPMLGSPESAEFQPKAQVWHFFSKASLIRRIFFRSECSKWKLKYSPCSDNQMVPFLGTTSSSRSDDVTLYACMLVCMLVVLFLVATSSSKSDNVTLCVCVLCVCVALVLVCAICNMQFATCNVQHAIGNMQFATCTLKGPCHQIKFFHIWKISPSWTSYTSWKFRFDPLSALK